MERVFGNVSSGSGMILHKNVYYYMYRMVFYYVKNKYYTFLLKAIRGVGLERNEE
jgi:hypothetical protein